MKSGIVGIIALVLVASLYQSPYVLFGGLVILAGSWYYFFLQDTVYLKIFLVTGCLGPCTEIVATYAGAWQYTMPQFAGIPVWLPVLWGLAGVFIAQLWQKVNRTK